MSKKTNFKRIALVAVAALGIGVLTSVAPASATAAAGDLTVAATSVGVCASDSGAPLSTIAMSKTGSLVITNGASGAADTVKVTGVLYVAASDGTISVDQKKVTNSTTITLAATGAGAGTFYSQTAGSGSVVQLVSVTVVDSCAGAAVTSAANSYIQVINATGVIQLASQLGTSGVGSTTALGTQGTGSIYAPASASTFLNTSVDQTTSFANGATAYVHALARDAYKLPLEGTAYYYGIACTGDVVVNGGSTNGGFIAGEANFYMPEFTVAQGTLNAGVATTCTLTVNNTVIGTKAITIKGDLAKIEASLRTSGESNTAAGAATAGTISYKYFDAAGNRLGAADQGLSTPSLTTTGSALINAISSVTATTKDTTGRVSYNCVGAAKSGDVSVVLKATNSAGATISANAVTASCGGALDTYTASLDKASYQTGDVATLTIKGLDVNGKKVNDSITAGAGAAIAITGMTPVTAPSSADAFASGELVYTYKVDNTAGNYIASVYLVAATQTAAVTQKVTITSQAGAVSNADVLKSIVSLIASINKQIQALQKLILKRK